MSRGQFRSRLGEEAVLGWRSFPAAGDGFHHVMGCGTAAARVHDGEPQADGPPLIVGRSAVRTGNVPPGLGGECRDDEPTATVTAIMTARGGVAPGAERNPRRAQ